MINGQRAQNRLKVSDIQMYPTAPMIGPKKFPVPPKSVMKMKSPDLSQWI